MRMTVGEIVDASHASLVRGEPARSVEGVSTDSRLVLPGELFVALAGESLDGHDFVDQAIARGAVAVLVGEAKRKPEYPGEAAVLSVRETLRALGDIAASYRSRFSLPFVAITGSNGKTTTKEMTAHVLSTRGTVVRARKSFNNFIGVPLTLFDAVPGAVAVVLEMGTNAPGEIGRLCDIARPQIGVITNIGATHLEGLKSVEGVAKAKAEMLYALGRDALAILNADDEWSRKIRTGYNGKIVTFGTSEGADIFARDIEDNATGLSFVTNEYVRVQLKVRGRHNVHNALAAIAVSRRLGMDMKDIALALADFPGVPMRMEVVRFGGVTVINDAYNANPRSMSAALDDFAGHYATTGTRHFICGDMLELGEHSAEFHRQLGRRIAECRIDRLWLLGTEVNETRAAAVDAGFAPRSVFLADDYPALEKAFLADVGEGDVVLVKGSRRMRLERLVEALRARAG